MSYRISLVVATYCPGGGLDRLVRSLDQQTLAASEFEVIFVDDGSTDDTWERLTGLQGDRANVTVERIPNSGWPSRPRNIGTDLATGEYVFYVDHDDEIFPDGLRAACEYADQHHLDVTSIKHAQTGNPGYAFEAWARDIAGDALDVGILSMTPMTPHKLYRRDWLREHGLRFKEGRRVIWEDIYFNIDAFAAAERIGTLGSTCVYHHILGNDNASHSYQPDREEYWRTVTEVLEHADRVLAAPRFDIERARLFASHYRDRVLRNILALATLDQVGALDAAAPYIDAIITTYVPQPPPGMSARDREVDRLWRAGDRNGLRRLQGALSGAVGISRCVAVEWTGPELRVVAQASWNSAGTVPTGTLGIEGTDPDLATELGQARSDLVLRARRTDLTIAVPTTSETSASTGDPLCTLRVQSASVVPVPPEDGVLDVYVRNAALGIANTRRLRTSTGVRVGLLDGRAVVVYCNTQGMLTIDVGQRLRSVVNSARRDYGRATIRRRRDRLEVELPLGDVHVAGTTRIDGSVELTAADGSASSFPAALIGAAARAHVELNVQVRPGRYRLAFTFAGRTVTSSIELTVPRLGRPTLADVAR